MLSEYTITYSLVFEHEADQKDADYLALFEGKNSEVAAGISLLTMSQSNAAIYHSQSLDFNFNVTGLKKEEITVQTDYTIYNYYGEVLAEGAEVHTISSGDAVDIPVHVDSGGDGMLFIDYSVTSEGSSYREYYPLAVLDSYSYTGEDSPFGLSGVRFGEYEANDDTVWIAENIGAANLRVCLSEPDYVSDSNALLEEYLRRLTEKGIHINGQFLLMDGWKAPDCSTTGQYQNQITGTLADVGQYLDSCQVGNEYNLEYAYLDVQTAMNQYEQSYAIPGYNSLSKYGQINIASAGVGLSRVNWMQQLAASDIYEKEDILTTHAYGFPYSPDFSSNPSIELVVESSYVRTRDFLDTYGDKTWYVGEVGYPTTANSTAGVASGCDLRSQADYTVREIVLALSYGADVVQVYNLYDQVNLFKGVDSTNQEYNFGLFYDQDYYGRILPKPSAIAYAVMTRQLDRIAECHEIETESQTVRAFEVTMRDSDEKVIVAWSTCYHISNDIGYDFVRTPNLPWNNQWKGTETVRLAVEADFAEAVDLMGNTRQVVCEEGILEIELDGSPVYIRCQ